MPGLLGSSPDPTAAGVGTQPGYPLTPLHSGSKFTGHQQSKGNKYQVEVNFKVRWCYKLLPVCILYMHVQCIT